VKRYESQYNKKIDVINRQKNYIGGDDGDSFSERAIDVPYGSFRRSRRFDDVEMANLGRYDRRSNLKLLIPFVDFFVLR